MKNMLQTKGKLPFVIGVALPLILSIIYQNKIFAILELVGIFIYDFDSVNNAYSRDKHSNMRLIEYIIVFIIAMIETFGGGLLRDIFILNRIPSLLKNPIWIIIAISAIGICVFCNKKQYSLHSVNIIFDIIGKIALISFIQGGFSLAYGCTQNKSIALLCGITTGCGGGILVILLSRKNYDVKITCIVKSLGQTLCGIMVLDLYDFKQNYKVIIAWCMFIVIENKFCCVLKAIYFSINKNMLFALKNIEHNYILYEPSKYNFEFIKYFVELYRIFILQFKRVKITKKNCNHDGKNYRSKKRYFYYRSAVKTFA